jgi:hypothetical protein
VSFQDPIQEVIPNQDNSSETLSSATWSDEDLNDLESEEPVPLDQQPTRQSSRSTVRHNYRELHSGKRRRALVSIPHHLMPLVNLVFSTIKATDFQRDQNGKDQRKVPKSYWEAKKSHWADWKPAFEKQMRDLEARDAWDLVYPPTGAEILPGKWVLDMKFNAQGQWDRNRARWVVVAI